MGQRGLVWAVVLVAGVGCRTRPSEGERGAAPDLARRATCSPSGVPQPIDDRVENQSVPSLAGDLVVYQVANSGDQRIAVTRLSDDLLVYERVESPQTPPRHALDYELRAGTLLLVEGVYPDPDAPIYRLIAVNALTGQERLLREASGAKELYPIGALDRAGRIVYDDGEGKLVGLDGEGRDLPLWYEPLPPGAQVRSLALAGDTLAIAYQESDPSTGAIVLVDQVKRTQTIVATATQVISFYDLYVDAAHLVWGLVTYDAATDTYHSSLRALDRQTGVVQTLPFAARGHAGDWICGADFDVQPVAGALFNLRTHERRELGAATSCDLDHGRVVFAGYDPAATRQPVNCLDFE